MAGIIKVNQYQDFNGNTLFTSDGNGNLTTQKTNYPAFCYTQNSAQALSGNTWTKLINYGKKVFDTNNAYDSSTGLFTPQVAGFYFFYADTYVNNSTDTKYIGLSKNSSTSSGDNFYFLRDTGGNQYHIQMTGVFELNGTSDTVSASGYNTTNAEDFGGTNSSRGRFMGFRIGS